jgi:hypothetical protein
MHTDITYPVEDEQREAKALADVEAWFGKKKFAELEAAFRADYPTQEIHLHRFRTLCSFAGVQGYPVGVWFRKLFPAAPTLTCEHEWVDNQPEVRDGRTYIPIWDQRCSKCGEQQNK